jgi:hypothetical protein
MAAAVTAGAILGVAALSHPHGPSVVPDPTGSAPVVRADLVNTVQVNGALSYALNYSVVNQASGTAYTWLPAAGTVIKRGHPLYEVDGTAVRLFYGARPQWRSMYQGMTQGPDVAQLDRNLIALGYGASLTVSDQYTWTTAAAVARWQQAAGLPATGTVPFGQVAFAPGPLRITAATPRPGTQPQPGTVILTATSPVPEVTAQVPVAQEYLVRPGDQVTVTLPDGVSTAQGVVTALASVAQPAQGDTAPSAPGQPGAGEDTVTMTVRLVHQNPAVHFDQAPVSVNIVSARASHVLAVPVSALMALAGGGYAVQVTQGTRAHASTRLVPVQIGLFDDTLVQVSGPGLTVGTRVGVPSS